MYCNIITNKAFISSHLISFTDVVKMRFHFAVEQDISFKHFVLDNI